MPKYLFSPRKRVYKAFEKELKRDQSREYLEDSPGKFYATKIYSCVIEALNPMPAELQDLPIQSLSLEKFTKQLCHFRTPESPKVVEQP